MTEKLSASIIMLRGFTLTLPITTLYLGPIGDGVILNKICGCLDADAVVGNKVCSDVDGYLGTIAFDD